MKDLIDFIFDAFPYVIAITLIGLCFISKDIKFKNNSNGLKEYYLKYRLSKNEDYSIVYSDEFEEISKITSDFLLVDIDSRTVLNKDDSMKILNSKDSDIMLGLGDWAQVWHKQ